ncbi:MAG: ribosomal protein [Proteobacteria bacterium]|nr:ribosomal protein [Pseudomonadota bacterium]
MTRTEKAEFISSLTEEFKSSDGLIVCDYKGLNVKAIEALRNASRPEAVSVKVIKNTLASIAMTNAGIEGLELKDTNIFVWGADQLAVTKVVATFAKTNPMMLLKLKHFLKCHHVMSLLECFYQLGWLQLQTLLSVLMHFVLKNKSLNRTYM